MLTTLLGHTARTSHVACNFDHLDLRNAIIDDAVGIKWCGCWYQWCHMTKIIMLHLNVMT